MIIDFQSDDASAVLFSVLDESTGRIIAGPVWYADDDRAIYRAYDLDESGGFFTRHAATKSRLIRSDRISKGDPDLGELIRHFSDGSSVVGCVPLEISWTEYYLPIRIKPRADLDPELLAHARSLMRQFREENGQ